MKESSLIGSEELRDYNFRVKKNRQERQKCRFTREKEEKGERGMPRLPEAMKDVVSCEKLRGSANGKRSGGVRMGEPARMKCVQRASAANAGN